MSYSFDKIPKPLWEKVIPYAKYPSYDLVNKEPVNLELEGITGNPFDYLIIPKEK